MVNSGNNTQCFSCFMHTD